MKKENEKFTFALFMILFCACCYRNRFIYFLTINCDTWLIPDLSNKRKT